MMKIKAVSGASSAVFFVLACVLMFFPGPSFAKKPRVNDPEAEQVAFAFYKLGGKIPDFKVWVQNRPDFQDIRISDRDVYLRNEISSLKQRFASYNPDEDLISVRIVADIAVEEIKTSSSFDPNEPRRFQLSVSTEDGRGNTLYFPYEISGQYIAVIANGLDKVLTREVDASLLEKIKGDIGYSRQTKTATAVLNFLLRPTSADMTQPMMLDGKNQWLMMAEIASFSATTSEEGEIIWEYKAPWYFTKVEKKIGGLYRP